MHRGVRKEDPIFSILFTATIQEVFKNVKIEEKGINVHGQKLSDPRFAGMDKNCQTQHLLAK